MAGAGWRDFVPGEVLTAANVQDYLQDQAVMVFASSAARTSALASPTEGMISYLKDDNIVQIYTGSSWVTIADDGGLPVANGGTGATTVAGAQSALGIKVLQVVSNVLTTEANNNTSTYAATGLSVSITPSSTSSKIVIFSSHDGCIKRPGNANSALNVRLMRGATVLQTSLNGGFNGTSSDLRFGSMSINYVDSPATTSSTTYSTEFANAFNGTGVAIGSGSLIVMEVAG